MGTFAICARNAAKSVAWEFSRSGKLRKYEGRTFSCKVNRFFGGALSVVSRCICGRPKKPKLTASNVADEEVEVYSAEFVYESIYEEIPAEVAQVKVKPFLLL